MDFQDWDDPHAAGPRSLYEELRNLGTVEVCDWAVDQMQVIGSADLVVSLAFPSTTVEALGAGRRAI